MRGQALNSSKELDSRLSLFDHLADSAGGVIAPLFRSAQLAIDYKEAASPIVTQADRQSEKVMREMIEAAFPDDGIHGEEYGIKEGVSGYSWILDPIDGTIAFSVGKPLFGTLVGLKFGELFLLGMIDQPVLKERYIGVNKEGQRLSSLNGRPIRSSSKSDLRQANLSFTSPVDNPGVEKLKAMVHVTSYGGDCYNYALLASGHVDIVVEKGLALHDFAALVPVIEGAGGLISDWQGEQIKSDSEGDIVATANAALHEQVLALLNA